MYSVEDKQFKDLKWPDQPREKCLHCEIVKPRRHSWFCRPECEDAYLRRMI